MSERYERAPGASPTPSARLPLPSEERPRTWGRSAAGGIGIVLLLTAAVGLVLRHVEILWRPVVLLTAFASYLLLLAPAAVPLVALARRWILTALAGVMTIASVWTLSPLYISSGPTETGPELTVMQFNRHARDVTASNIVEEIRQRHVDLLALEEINDAIREQLRDAGLDLELRFHFYATVRGTHTGPVGLWSRYPVTQTRVLFGFSRGGIAAVVKVPGTTGVSVAVVHLASPAVDTASLWGRELRNLRDVARQLATQAEPVVLAGDLNSTLDHAQLRDVLHGGYEDAVEQAGAGFVPTYPSSAHYPPVLGIDHVIGRGVRAESVASVHVYSSMHRALIVRLQLAG